jgi:hypothetical protein
MEHSNNILIPQLLYEVIKRYAQILNEDVNDYISKNLLYVIRHLNYIIFNNSVRELDEICNIETDNDLLIDLYKREKEIDINKTQNTIRFTISMNDKLNKMKGASL